MALQLWRTGKVIRITETAEATRSFFIQIPELERFDFQPGQFVTLDLPIDEKPNKRLRSYSIASWPDGSNIIELCIVLLEGGAGTTYLFNHVEVGSELVLRGPVGVFTLPEPLDKDFYMICTGTGIAPFRSMLHYIAEHNIPHKELYLIFGTRFQKNLLYLEELRHLTEILPGFHYVPVLSREEWNGKTGYVHQVYENLLEEKKQHHGELHPANFYLCGWKNMIDEAKQRIQSLGYDRKSIHQELYG